MSSKIILTIRISMHRFGLVFLNNVSRKFSSSPSALKQLLVPFYRKEICHQRRRFQRQRGRYHTQFDLLLPIMTFFPMALELRPRWEGPLKVTICNKCWQHNQTSSRLGLFENKSSSAIYTCMFFNVYV